MLCYVIATNTRTCCLQIEVVDSAILVAHMLVKGKKMGKKMKRKVVEDEDRSQGDENENEEDNVDEQIPEKVSDFFKKLWKKYNLFGADDSLLNVYESLFAYCVIAKHLP